MNKRQDNNHHQSHRLITEDTELQRQFFEIPKGKTFPSDKFICTDLNREITPSVSAMEYGKRQELNAKVKYLKVYPSRHFHEYGLIIHSEFEFLGVTPDGKLCDGSKTGIVEIKCPYSARNMTISDNKHVHAFPCILSWDHCYTYVITEEI